eukprot:358937-Chlamydomonas_euryale.AAC.10
MENNRCTGVAHRHAIYRTSHDKWVVPVHIEPGGYLKPNICDISVLLSIPAPPPKKRASSWPHAKLVGLGFQ